MASEISDAMLFISDVEPRHAALGLGDEVDMFHRALLEGDSPVGRIVAHRGWDMEAFRQLGIDCPIGARVEVFHKLPFGYLSL